jgi:hypothetical protein
MRLDLTLDIGQGYLGVAIAAGLLADMLRLDMDAFQPILGDTLSSVIALTRGQKDIEVKSSPVDSRYMCIKDIDFHSR